MTTNYYAFAFILIFFNSMVTHIVQIFFNKS